MPRLSGRTTNRPTYSINDLLVSRFVMGDYAAKRYPICCIKGCDFKIRESYEAGLVVLSTDIYHEVGAICGIHLNALLGRPETGYTDEPPF